MRLDESRVTDRLTYVLDLDGVIYRGMEPQPHAKETVLALRDRGYAVRFYTNNSAQSRLSYAAKLESMGIPTPPDHIMTSLMPPLSTSSRRTRWARRSSRSASAGSPRSWRRWECA